MKFNPFDRGTRTAPSHYPRIPFHAIRCAQLLSSLIVGLIMAYFMYYLHHDRYSIPWTFIWLMSASLFSAAALFFTIILHCFTGLNPRLNLALNSILAVFWVLGWSLLTWFMSDTLANKCDPAHWHEDIGIHVCRTYKALFTFSLVGVISTLAALALDIYVFRSHTQRGIYRLQDLDHKNHAAANRPQATRGPFTDVNDDTTGYGDESSPRESEAWEEPRPSLGPYSERSERQVMGSGYAVPEGQFAYGDADTGYRGHDLGRN